MKIFCIESDDAYLEKRGMKLLYGRDDLGAAPLSEAKAPARPYTLRISWIARRHRFGARGRTRLAFGPGRLILYCTSRSTPCNDLINP